MAEETTLKSQMGSDEPVKFTDEELQSLQELQNTYASISTQRRDTQIPGGGSG